MPQPAKWAYLVRCQTDMTLDDQDMYFPRNEWSDKEKLEKEKEVMGFYLSAHPLDI